MPERVFDHYDLCVTAGPRMTTVDTFVSYFDDHGEVIGTYGESLIGFATTWRDVALVVRNGLRNLGYDQDPVRAISPMVDLT